MNSHIHRFIIILMLCVIIPVAYATTNGGGYQIIDLGTLGGSGSIPAAINERGQVIGWNWMSNGAAGFLWDNGQMTDLGTLGGSVSYAIAINELGQVVGISETASGETHPFLWNKGQMTELEIVSGAYYSRVSDINKQGQVVGYSSISCGRKCTVGHALLWKNGQMTDLGTLSGGV